MSMIFAMSLFSLSMSISPGPVNLITLSAGINHGAKKAMPFVTGATLSFVIMLLLVGLGIGQLAAENAGLMTLIAYLGAAFIAYMGFKLAISQGSAGKQDSTLPSFSQGALLQWLNPKAWIACVSGVSAFSLSNDYPMLLLFSALYFLICYAAVSSWAIAGARISRWLGDSTKLRRFNRIMGVTLILVAVYLCVQLNSAV